MDSSTLPPSPPSSTPTSHQQGAAKNRLRIMITFAVAPVLSVVLAVLLYQLDSFDPAPYPAHVLTHKNPIAAPKRNARVLEGAEKIGDGKLLAPEDIAYDPISGVIYTGCADGWIKRVTVNESAAESVVEDWVNTGGRPLGVVCGHHGEVIVADADKGLLKVTSEGAIEVLTAEADGLKFGLTDGVDIADNGVIYFTDASYKYSLGKDHWDILEGRPYGRFMSYDPSTKETKVLLRDLYFANGVCVAPDQQSVIFCESPLAKCKRYYINGERKGSVEIFVEGIPGMPDNIRYDGEGQYWIALPTEVTHALKLAQRYPFIRKIAAILEKYVGRARVEKNGGALAVDLEGKPTSHYHDRDLFLVTGVIKIGDHLYFGSVNKPYILSLNIKHNPAERSSGCSNSMALSSCSNIVDSMRYERVNCRECGREARVMVSNSVKNPGRLYYGCPFHGWLKWVIPATMETEADFQQIRRRFTSERCEARASFDVESKKN